MQAIVRKVSKFARGHPGVVLNKGYSHSGASRTKRNFNGFTVSSGSPAEDIDSNNYTMRQRSRILFQSAPVATAALKRMRTNIVGPGLRLKCAIDRDVLGMTEEQAEAWERHTQAEFSLWANNRQACDATGVNNFHGLQQLVMLSWPMSGDVFALIKRDQPTARLPYSLRLHLLEADRVRTPDNMDSVTAGTIVAPGAGLTTAKLSNGNTIYDGVEVDSGGKIVAYHVANTYPYQLNAEKTEFVRIHAYGEKTGLPNILHIMDTERPEQYRGVPYLAQVIEPLLQIRRYSEAEITAAVIQSLFTAFITTDAAQDGRLPINEVGGGDGGEREVSRDPNEYEMGVGTTIALEPGEDVKFSAPTHPNTGFDKFLRAMCELIGAALEIPADLLLMQFNSSYSASRAALMEAWKGFRMRREWLTDNFCRPTYELWMCEAVARGRISAPGFFTDPLVRQAYLGSKWIGPAQGQLDPVKEVNASVIAIENGLSTREDEATRLNGSEYPRNVAKLKSENAALREANGGKLPGESTEPPNGGDNEEKEGDNDA